MPTVDTEFETIFHQYVTGMQSRYRAATGQTLTVNLNAESNESEQQTKTSPVGLPA